MFFITKDERDNVLENNAYGTVSSHRRGEDYPVVESAGFSPFGFGYRRCPGERFTINVLKEFLKLVWSEKIEFQKLGIPEPELLPVAPSTFARDNIGFYRS